MFSTTRPSAAELRQIGARHIAVSALSVGTAGLSSGEGQEETTAAFAAAHAAGIRYFDTAPYYGLGQSEFALGEAMRGYDRGGITLSTKVGRTVDPETKQWSFDFSRDAVLRGLESSLLRLGTDRIDIVYVHDPDSHADEAIDSAFPTLAMLRSEGVIGAFGAGMNQWQIPLRLVREADLDVLLIAGRYSLLDASAAQELLPACLERGVSVVLAGVLNSGILANPGDGAQFDYRPASAEKLERARAIQEVAVRHGVTLREAAFAFGAAHPAVSSVLLGVSSEQQLRENLAAWRTSIPAAFWAELRAGGLLPVGATAPA